MDYLQLSQTHLDIHHKRYRFGERDMLLEYMLVYPVDSSMINGLIFLSAFRVSKATINKTDILNSPESQPLPSVLRILHLEHPLTKLNGFFFPFHLPFGSIILQTQSSAVRRQAIYPKIRRLTRNFFLAACPKNRTLIV